jgi:hypothetical protein
MGMNNLHVTLQWKKQCICPRVGDALAEEVQPNNPDEYSRKFC